MPLLTVACALLLGCASGPAPATTAAPRHADVVDVLMASADAWNRGDLDGFIAPYQNSPSTSYAGRSGFVQGFDRLRETYARSYWASGGPADSLAFEVVDLRPLDERAALLLGRYLLKSPSSGAVTSQGIFSLVFIHTPHGWKITHDHSAETP